MVMNLKWFLRLNLTLSHVQVAGIIDSVLHNAMHVMKKVELGKQY